MTPRVPSATKNLVGVRRRSREIDPGTELARAQELLQILKSQGVACEPNLKSLKQRYSGHCRTYYTVAAISRRKVLDHNIRSALLSVLYSLRAQIELRILDDLRSVADQSGVWKEATGRSFFGFSSKQGVSIRYPLASCIPTADCGARCYGHDGRDRELHLIFRAALNYFCGNSFEHGSAEERAQIMQRLSPAIKWAVHSAMEDQRTAAKEGFMREPRIRFAHIGEMVSTPNFANSLASAIKRCNPEVACVVYTRHPKCSSLDPALFRINFTIDSADDKRRRFAPAYARVVSSAWDGDVSPEADVSFLEHHVEKGSSRRGTGFVCPVTADHSSTPSCDSAKCDVCFRSKCLR
jgi:hypothetical protein